MDGTNQDDHHDYRPGRAATEELGVRSPLSEVGLTKQEIRLLSKQMGLRSWSKPSLACLASRIPYHTPITTHILRRVDEAEEFLRSLDISGQVRVRYHGDVARLEVAAEDFPVLIEEKTRQQVVDHFKSLGFQFIALDLEGYGMGSMNRLINADLDEGKRS